MSFRDQQVEEVKIISSGKDSLEEKLKELMQTNVIIDLQYSVTRDLDGYTEHHALVLMRKKGE